MMSGVKLDVNWSPVHHDKFIIWGPDITLYEVSRIKDIEKKTTFTPISSTRGATVIASQSASGVRCVDISAIPDQPEPLLALGYASGKVTLTTLKQTYDPLGLVGREFTPRYPRLCNSVSWSHVETNMLAVAMEKHRSDHCILLWDVYRGSMLPDEARGVDSATAMADSNKPLAEMGLSETAHSVAWSNCANRTLLASMNLKYIKLFDLRDLSNKAVSVTTTRYCYGVCADPFNPWQLASRGDNVVCVWDARALDRPLLTLPQPRPLQHIQWCPTRRNLLLSLQRESTALRIHDIQQANNDTKVSDNMTTAMAVEAELEEQYSRGPHVIERDVTPAGGTALGTAHSTALGTAHSTALGTAHGTLVAFSWHAAHEGRLLAVCANGGVVEYTVCERSTVSWGCGPLVWSGGGGLRQLHRDFYAAVKDVSYVMKKRADTDYGLKPDLWQNADLAEDAALSGLWHFLALSKSLVEDGCIRNSPWRHPGVRTVLRSAGDGGYRSEIVPSLLPDLPNRRVTVYRSAERTRALQLCGWGWGWENALAGVERAEAEGTPCRAAALAAFQLRVRAALDVLARAAQPQLRVAALALAGLSDERYARPALAAFQLRVRAALDVLARAAQPQLRVAALALAGLSDERYARPALAAFQLRVRAALDVLARAAQPQLRVAALALAGLSDERYARPALAAFQLRVRAAQPQLRVAALALAGLSDERYARPALAAFQLRVRAALDVLARAAQPQLRVAALALAGLSDERYARPALAAFQLRVRAALDVLARAAQPQLRVAALALAGLSDERYARPALAAFQLRVRAAQPQLRVAALALAGLSDERYARPALAAFQLRVRAAQPQLRVAALALAGLSDERYARPALAAFQLRVRAAQPQLRVAALALAGLSDERYARPALAAFQLRVRAAQPQLRVAALALAGLSDERYARPALAAFQLRVRAAQPQLRVAALALAGLSDERLWREALAAAASALPDPYLRALLLFLAASAPAHHHHHQPPLQPDFAPVLNETEMRLEDRVAFACIFLSDVKLHEYVRHCTEQLVEQGDLSGILLTGASPEGISLLQRWIENTGDVQSAALVAARCFTGDLLKEPRVANWLDSYRSILDGWQAWWARCALDTWVCGAEGAEPGLPRHVCVACTYCGKSVAAPPGHNRPRVAFARLPPPAAKMKQISSCPNCRKPLPRCGVCSLHLGTAAGGAGGQSAAGAQFGRWFSWCVACRHGGHAEHLLTWFKEHTECPVSSCNCHCSTLDPPDRP